MKSSRKLNKAKAAEEKAMAFRQAQANALQPPGSPSTDISSFGGGFSNPHPGAGNEDSY